MMFYDLHTHTFHSDGELSPVELINRAACNGYKAIAITDHVAIGSLERIINEIREDCALASRHWQIKAIPGVELTHVPPDAICELAQAAKQLGALVVVVHGETTLEPVPKGTNKAAINCPYVDILAHPGWISLEDAEAAARNGIYLELSARRGHRDTNKHVANMAIKSGAKMIINSDAHNEDNLLHQALVDEIITTAGLNHIKEEILIKNPESLIRKIYNNQK